MVNENNEVQDASKESVIQSFNFNNIKCRMILDENGEPWFVAKDVCDILEITVEATRHLDDDERGLTKCQTPGGVQTMTTIH